MVNGWICIKYFSQIPCHVCVEWWQRLEWFEIVKGVRQSGCFYHRLCLVCRLKSATCLKKLWTNNRCRHWLIHRSSWVPYCDVIMGTMASQITSPTIVCSTVYSGADQRKHQSSASLAFVQGIHRWPENVSIWWRHHTGHGGTAFLWPDVVISWQQYQVTREPHLHDSTNSLNFLASILILV